MWAFALELIDPWSGFTVMVITNIAFGITFLLAYRDEAEAQEEING